MIGWKFKETLKNPGEDVTHFVVTVFVFFEFSQEYDQLFILNEAKSKLLNVFKHEAAVAFCRVLGCSKNECKDFQAMIPDVLINHCSEQLLVNF